jgi:hypothetical protein
MRSHRVSKNGRFNDFFPHNATVMPQTPAESTREQR